ncbi:hypothetical protein, partial [uncultured Acinetobacter sp.]|uniref:hypothetical protein n=1 Tax=uncultured Acinetobacter sp. TaxID=165433 RepID=UPI00258F8656
SQQVISIFLKLYLQTHNPTIQAKLLFFNKFLSASPPMDVHSTLFLTPCKLVGLKFLLHGYILNQK